MTALSLFTGYAGIDLALNEYVEPIAYVEIEEYAQRIIAERMADGSITRAPILADVKNVRGEIGDCEIIYGGFPCQDISTAGNGKGLAGERSGLFFEIIRLVSEIRPSFVFLENVPAITVRGLDRVLLEFTSLGYDCRWTHISAASVGAPHKRDRWFLLAYTNCEQLRNESGRIESKRKNQTELRNNGKKKPLANSAGERFREEGRIRRIQSSEWISWGSSKMADTNGSRLERSRRQESKQYGFTKSCWWTTEPDVGRVANGIANRVDRVKALGNGVVPLQVKTAFEKLMGIERGK